MLHKKNHTWIFNLLIYLILILFISLSILLHFPSLPEKQSVPNDQVSAERAFKHVEELAKYSRPTGSEGHESGRRYII